MAGVLVWSLAMLSAMLFPNRLTLSFAVGGALLVGVGLLAVAYSSACPGEDLPALPTAITGEPQFALHCLY